MQQRLACHWRLDTLVAMHERRIWQSLRRIHWCTVPRDPDPDVGQAARFLVERSRVQRHRGSSVGCIGLDSIRHDDVGKRGPEFCVAGGNTLSIRFPLCPERLCLQEQSIAFWKRHWNGGGGGSSCAGCCLGSLPHWRWFCRCPGLDRDMVASLIPSGLSSPRTFRSVFASVPPTFRL